MILLKATKDQKEYLESLDFGAKGVIRFYEDSKLGFLAPESIINISDEPEIVNVLSQLEPIEIPD